jgi:hypothetical protein
MQFIAISYAMREHPTGPHFRDASKTEGPYSVIWAA